MSTNTSVTFLARLARRPVPIFLGVAVGFLSCCIAGRVAARQQSIKFFVRFHQGLTPAAHYYPTYSQALNVARERVKPGKILVIICGDSVFHGTGQRATHIWTIHLQKLLGDDYSVVNLAIPGGVPQEFGIPIAEQLQAEGVPVIVVCRGNIFDWDGYLNRYIFWDAWGKGYIQPDSRRDTWLAEFTTKYAKEQKSLELKHRGRVDGVTYAADLWTHLSYKYCSTVWSPLRYPNFWRPYREVIDSDPGATIDWESRFNPSPDSNEVTLLRRFVALQGTEQFLRGEQDDYLGQRFTSFFPDSLQGRLLLVFRQDNSFYRSRLTPEEQVKQEAIYRRYRDATRKAGFHAELVAENYVPHDFVDMAHLSEQGGEKMAAELAPVIRQMSERLYGQKSTPNTKGTQP
jgi:hypothetical protein